MSPDSAINYTDNHYSEKIDCLLLDMIDNISEIEYLKKMNPQLVGNRYIDFIRRFVNLYDLTCDYLECNHMKETDKDKEIRKTIEDTIYYLNGINSSNGHTIHINKETVNNGIELFRKYKKYLYKEGIMVVH